MQTLAEIRAKLKAEQEKAEAQKNGTFTGERKADSFLAFWNVPYNEPLNLRFLPDADESNPFFWRERDMINLTFQGVVGLHTDKVTVQVPCNEMWVPKSCPVLKEVRQWFQSANESGDEELKAMAGRYWKKKTYLMQCFIAPDSVAVKDDMAPENPIRRILANKDIFDKVKSILLNPGIKELPTHYTHGRDFGIVKTKNGGGYNSYDMSQFSMSERELNADEMAAIEKYGLYNLNDFMPKQPTPEELTAIAEMFEASVNGEAYDPARWAFAYRPAGVQKPVTGGSAPAAQPAPQAPVTPQPAPQAAVQESTPVTPTAPVTPAAQPAPTAPASTGTEAPKEQLSASALVARLKQQSK